MVAVGIDLGTTFSAVAAVDLAGRPVILSGADGEPTMPSVVFFDGETPVVGLAAKRAATIAPQECVEFVKRHIGDPAWRFETRDGTAYTAEQISALILRRLAAEASAALGQPITEAVITVPAYFDDARRRATADAGRIAGLDVLWVLNEPTAAALAFGYGADRDETLLVYDLGGGTCDVTAVHVAGGRCEVLATAGDRNLGGFDFDNALMLYVNESVRAAGGPNLLDGDLYEAELRERCEHAKRTVSTLPEAAVRLDVDGTGYAAEITRLTFESLTASLLRRTEEIVQEVLAESGVARAGQPAGRRGVPPLSTALLVGGSTRMPMVAAMLERVTGVRADRSVHPDEAVALGAALQADAITRTRGVAQPGTSRRAVTIHDVTSQSLGVVARSNTTGEQANSVVIGRNTPIPCQGRRRFRTLAENQREILLVVTEGDDDDVRYVTVVGSARIPIAPRAASVAIDVIMSYDQEGMIHVDVVEAETERHLGEFEIDRQANLDAREVERMREALRSLRER
jgi:molecular chaperone DnaK